MNQITLESKELRNYSLVVFDLDNTLYKETDFLFSAYQEIEKYVSEKACIPFNDVNGFLRRMYLSKGRNGLFDNLLRNFDIENIVTKSEMLNILRNHSCELSLFKYSESLLNQLHQDGKILAILTNGNLTQQKNKINCLNLRDKFPYIDVVYAAEIEPKPSPKGLFILAERNNCVLKNMVFIGDSMVDEETAQNAGVDFFYINCKNERY